MPRRPYRREGAEAQEIRWRIEKEGKAARVLDVRASCLERRYVDSEIEVGRHGHGAVGQTVEIDDDVLLRRELRRQAGGRAGLRTAEAAAGGGSQRRVTARSTRRRRRVGIRGIMMMSSILEGG